MPLISEKGKIVWKPPTKKSLVSFSSRLFQKEVSETEPQIEKEIEKIDIKYQTTKSFQTSLSSLLKKNSWQVDIIIPVYNGVHVVKKCVESVIARTEWPYKITIVDDCSPDQYTQEYLTKLVSQSSVPINLIRNKKNKGFAATVNVGMKNTTSPYICLLNSDVIVTDNWLTKMVMALESDPKNKIVNPVTNNTALIDVPLQENFSYIDMNKALETTSTLAYPDIMPTGFCFMFKRDILNDIGPFDEGFVSYGEETSFFMKTISKIKDGEFVRWRAILADNTYLFHERGSSFSSLGNDSHMSMRQVGSQRFHSIWPQFKDWQKSFKIEDVMKPFRIKFPNEIKETKSPYNISFVVHSTGLSGGMAVIADIINELIERRINVNLSVIKRKAEGKIPVIGNLRIAPTVFDCYEDFIENFSTRVFSSGVVVAGTIELVPPIRNLIGNYKKVLFAQSYDPELIPEGTPEIEELVNENYREIEYIICGSSWVDEKIKKEFKRDTFGAIKPGVDTDLFYPRDRSKGDERPTVLFSLMNTYPYKGYDRGIKVAANLVQLCKKNNKDIRLMAYGPMHVHSVPEIIGLGILAQPYLAKLLGTEIDVFCDPSLVHSYGLPSLEAIACGVRPICWDNRGIREYATEKEATILPETATPEEVATAIYKWLFESGRGSSETQGNRGSFGGTIQSRFYGVNDFISRIESSLQLTWPKKKVTIITPHLRKNGGPTTILTMAEHLQNKGHDVKLYTVYPEINPEVIGNTKIPIFTNWKNIQECDVLITNSDNDRNTFFNSFPLAKRKVMLKLSHNARFFPLENGSLNMHWDDIITSTEWLKDACENPQRDKGWDHPPVSATKIGWYHYFHEDYKCPPDKRTYGDLNTKIRIGFLAHQHQLKGTSEAVRALQIIKEKYGDKVQLIGIGEWPQFAKGKPPWIGYQFNPDKKQHADYLKSLDIWLTASFTEGLGRMALEAMSASVACVITDTGAEYAENEENCLMVGKGNHGQMAKAIDRLIQDKELFTKITTNAYDTACKYSDPTEYVEKLNQIICK